MADLEGAVNRELERVLADGVTDAELTRTRGRLLAEAVFARDSLSGAARVFGNALTSGEQVGDVEAWPSRIAAVTVEQVHAAARHVLRSEQSVTAQLLPEAAWRTTRMLTELLARPQLAAPANGARVEAVVARCGVRAYLLREPTVPFLSLALHIAGGAAADPPERLGLAFMATGLLDEGAGPYDSQAFRGELEDHAIRLQFEADRDGISGELRTLTATREHAFALLRLALHRAAIRSGAGGAGARPDPGRPASTRIRPRLSGLACLVQRGVSGPSLRPPDAWRRREHRRDRRRRLPRLRRPPARARPAAGWRCRRHHGRGAGAVARRRLRRPACERTVAGIASGDPTVGSVEVLRLDIPQSVVVFGHGGLERHDPDYYAGYVANYILGGGGFSSRLLEEVREKRGLAYSAYSYMHELDKAPLWLGSVATNNQQVAQSLEIIRAELARMARGELDETDLADARTYLTGSFPCV